MLSKWDLLAKGVLDKVVVVRLPRNESLIEGLTEVAKKEGITSGVVLSLIGTTQEAVFRNPRKNTPCPITAEHEGAPDVDTTFVEGPCEIINGSGNISLYNGEPWVHLHLTVSEAGGRLAGGHLFRAKIWTQCEAVIALLKGVNIERKVEPETNLPQIYPQQEG